MSCGTDTAIPSRWIRCRRCPDLRDADLPDGLMAAVPLQVFASSRWPGRGRSIYANKTDAFDALDEVVSQWMDAIRHGRVIRYIPNNMIPRDANNGSDADG